MSTEKPESPKNTTKKTTDSPIVTLDDKKYVVCDVCTKSVAASSFRRHQRSHAGERSHWCHVCGLGFIDAGNLSRHARAVHAAQRPHACHLCHKSFTRSGHLRDHLNCHSGAREFICDRCGKGYTSGSALRMHKKRHDTDYKFHCVDCGAKFKRRGELRAHVTVHTGERAFECTTCSRAYRLRSQLNAHSRVHAAPEFEEYVVVELEAPPPPPSITCPYCSAQHNDAPAHEEHLVAAHSDLLFHCDECHQYVDRKDLILHMSVHAVQYTISTDNDTEQQREDVDNKTVKVEDPRKSKASDENRKPESEQNPKDSRQDSISRSPAFDKDEEVSTSVGENEFSDHTDTEDGFGPLPESVFEAIEDSQDSQPADATPTRYDKPTTPQKENKKKKDKVRTCPICFKVYLASSSYFYHMKYFHRGSREHQCEVCSRRFATRASLSQHALTHTDELKYTCSTCEKRFRSKASLYIHSQLHVGKKEFTCSACGRCFAWRQLLLRHMKRHAAEKSHVCGVCGRGFNIRCDLSRHLRTHNAGCHACDKCGAKFAQLRYLKVHMDKKHTAISSETVPEGLSTLDS